MAKQLQKLVNLEERRKQLDEALKNGGLTKQQYDQEMAKLNEQAKGLQKLQQMAGKLQDAQKAMQNGDMKKAAEALGLTEKQLSEAAKNLQELEALDSAMAELQDCKNGMCSNDLNMIGDTLDDLDMGKNRRPGGNRLGRGRGQGDRPESPDQTAEYKTKVKQQMGKGKAYAEGTAPSNTPVKGQSLIDIQGEMATTSGNAADALTNQKVPRNVEKHIRDYFDQVNKGK